MIRYYRDFVQGSDDWLQARCGLLTASEMKLIITPTLRFCSNDKERAHLYELMAQRITGYVEPHYVSDDMLRGHEDEVQARILYEEHFAKVDDVGFITNDRWGFTLGYSPDGLVSDNGAIECKSRRQKYQIETWVEAVRLGIPPIDYMLQIQTGLLVSERQWIDFVSYSGGLPMAVIRTYPDAKVQSAIIEAAAAFEARVAERMQTYRAILQAAPKLIETERRVETEILI